MSAACKDFLNQLLEKDSAKRLSSEEALKHAWFEGLQEGDENMNMDMKNNKQIASSLAA